MRRESCRLLVVAALAALSICACARQNGTGDYEMRALVRGGSPFHGVHGLRFDSNDRLYAVSVIGQSVFRVDMGTGAIETVVGPPQGMADDIAIARDGTLVWTAIEDGIVYVREPDGRIRHLMDGMRGVNAVAFSPDEDRLFVSLVFYGDALYELDLRGGAAPRLIREGMGGLNAFEVADNGMIYGPLVFGAQVVRIDPDTGAMSTISDDFVSAGALKLESQTSALVLDDGKTLKRVNLLSGATSVVADLPFGADNLDIDSKGRVLVSLSEVNGIAEVDPVSGAIDYLVEPAPLTSATGLAVYSDARADTVYIGDLFGGVKRIDASTGSIDAVPSEIFQPAHVSAGRNHLLVVGQVFGEVQLLDRNDFSVLQMWTGLNRPGDALETADGDVIVAETGAGRVLRLRPDEPDARITIAGDLASPVGLAPASADAVYVSDAAEGRVLRITLDGGEETIVAAQLRQPEGIAVDARGNLLIMEVGAKRLLRVEPRSGSESSVLAENLPIGLSNGPSLYRGVAASDRAIYFNSDIDNSVYMLAGQ